MHSPQPFPSGSAPVAVQSRPVSNRTYSAEIPRLDRCRHSSSAATSRIIAYQKRSHARISVPYQNPFCKPFLRDFPDFFRIFFATPHLVPPCRRAHKISSPAGAYYYIILGGVEGVIACRRGVREKGCHHLRRGKSYKGLNSHACPAGADFCSCKRMQNTVKGCALKTRSPICRKA